MSKRSIACCIVGCLGIAFFVALGCRDWSRQIASVFQGAPPAEQARFITIPDIFVELERPPSRFVHDKHTRALGPGSCKKCHARDKSGDVDFTYPKGADRTSRDALMDSFHDDCIGCHTKRTQQGQKSGPVTCGECHVIERACHEHEYVPVLPEYYDPLRDTYHKDCLACHRESAHAAEKAETLDWKGFYVSQKKTAEEQWPKVSFDYLLHDMHDKALEGNCKLCHYISPERQEQLKAEGKEPANQDWVLDVDPQNSLTEQASAHARCINCHLKRKAQKERAGPVTCGKCHSGKQRTIEELADVARPECAQEKRILIRLEEGARAKAVAFNHESHVANSRSCQECHHKTLRSCGECHDVEGTEEGGFITLAEAYHDVSSSFSCVGCHETQKKKPNCAACHQRMPGGLVQSACSVCHSGSLDVLDAPMKLPAPEDLIPDDVEAELKISGLENEYESSKMPHLAIAKSLTDISNNSKLASRFHTKATTVCAGCHHLGPLEAKTAPARCSTCHTTRNEPENNTPTLLGAYHQQCLGCHQQMGATEQEMPQSCTGCHQQKAQCKAQCKKCPAGLTRDKAQYEKCPADRTRD